MGDWRMLFLQRDRLKAVTAEDVNRVAAKYIKPSNRTLGEYVPTEKPDRAEVPEARTSAELLKGYTGNQGLAKGEAFDPSPANIDSAHHAHAFEQRHEARPALEEDARRDRAARDGPCATAARRR